MLRRLLFVALPLALAACGGTPTRPLTPEPAPEPPPRPAPEAAPLAYDLAPTFAANRGRLPWPATGTVTGFFGRRTDAATGTVTQAVGIDVATAPEAPVRAVYNGRVSRVGQMAAFGTYVMLKHGGWTTVYGNLSRVNVQAGDSLGAGAVLGAAGDRDDRRGSSLFFALFEGEAPADPIPWLGPRDGTPPAASGAPARPPASGVTTQAPPPEAATPAAPGRYVPQPIRPDSTRTRRGGWEPR